MINELLITRVFKAPRELVFEALTQAEHLAHWWGPVGFQLEILELDVRPGGRFHYRMIPPEGQEMYGLFQYREIAPPHRMVFTNSFADRHGNIINAPFDAAFPREVLNTWTLEEKAGKTTLTHRGVALTDRQEAIAAFTGLHENMTEGFNKTFDQLEFYIRSKFNGIRSKAH